MTKNVRKAKSMSTLSRPSNGGGDNGNGSHSTDANEAKTLQEVREALRDIGRPYISSPPRESEVVTTEQKEKATFIDPYPQNPKRVAFMEQASSIHDYKEPRAKVEAIPQPSKGVYPLPAFWRQQPQPVAAVTTTNNTPAEAHRNSKDAAAYTKPFCDFLTDNPTVFHCVSAVASSLTSAGYRKLSEREPWKLETGGQYFVERNGSSILAFSVGDDYESGNGVAMLAGHVDALTAKLKPIPKLQTKAGYVQLGVAPYAGALNSTWWDRDLGIGGRVLVREASGKVTTKLVKLGWPIARIPTLAPHFGAAANGPFNPETQMVPIIGLDNSDISSSDSEASLHNAPSILGGAGSFTASQPARLVKAIANELNITDLSTIINWELELFDVQSATTGGLDHEFIFAGRIDDKLCSWAAVQALLNTDTKDSGVIKLVGLFDDEEVGSGLRQGAKGNFLPIVIERIVESLSSSSASSSSGTAKDTLARTYANSFLISSDVIHAVNPNFLNAYLPQHSPRLNTGLAITADANAHMTTDSVSTSILASCLAKHASKHPTSKTGKLQVFQIRNDSRSGGTVGPMLSSQLGVRAVDAGIVQLSMHSIRATTGSLDPGLGVLAFEAFLREFEGVDGQWREF